MSKIKKKYKLFTILMIFFICLIVSFCIYVSYDKEDKENINIENGDIKDNTVIPDEDNVLIAMLPSDEETNEWVEIKSINEMNREVFVNSEGIEYYVDCTLTIPKIGLEYPVLSETSTLLLEHNLNKFWGCEPNKVGNYVIAGHNYKNDTYFGKLDELAKGDIIKITDINGNTVQYKIYDMYYVDPEDVSCTSQLTDGRREVTLITCNATGSKRLVVKSAEI